MDNIKPKEQDSIENKKNNSTNKGKIKSYRFKPNEKLNKILNDLTNKIENNFNGMIKMSAAEILEEGLITLSENLSTKTLKRIENKKFNSSLKLKFLLDQALEAERDGIDVSIDDLLRQHAALFKNSKNRKKTKNKQVLETQEKLETAFKKEVSSG